jgi:pimeloyl-ACP methyl ester carboxylesterase
MTAPFADRYRRLGRIAVVTMSGILLAGCGLSGRADTVAPLAWTSCPFDTKDLDTARMRCGTVTVPENRDHDRGRRLRLAFAVIKALTPAPETSDAFLFLSGGPGDAALASPILLARVAPALAVDRDFVMFDQRGTGHSEPAMCPNRLREDARLAALDVGGAELRALKKTADLACRDELLAEGIDPSAYHSRASADDTEDLRRALGYRQWTLWGGSYGGALAQSIMNRHAGSVRAAVLTAPGRFDDFDWFDFVRHITTTLQTLTRLCDSAPACRRAFPDPVGEFHAVAERLQRAPMTVAVDSAVFGRSRFTVNAGDFIGVLDDLTSRGWDLPFVPRVIRAFRDRDSAVVAAAVEQSLGGGDSSAYSPALQMLVRCHDFAADDSRRRWQQVMDDVPLERELEFLFDICDDLPGRAAPGELMLAVSRIPTLILSGRFDNREPPAHNAMIMETFRNSRQIVFANAAHVIPSGATWDCFQRLVLAFTRTPEAFPDGSCATGPVTLTVSTDLPEWARPRLPQYARTLQLNATPDTSANVSVGDLDGDGTLDILLVNGRHWGGRSMVMLGDGHGRFPTVYPLSPERYRSYSGRLVDLDGNGHLDVVLSNDTPDPKMIFLNDGTGRFRAGGQFGRPAWETRNVAVADLNRDGLPDIVVANRSDHATAYICLNQGHGRFPADCAELAHISATTITPADIDGDGAVDLVVPHRDGGQSDVYLNDGTGDFARAKTIPFGPPNATIRMAEVADLNRDGRLDIVAIDDEHRGVWVYFRQRDGSFSAGLPLDDGHATPYALAVADLNQDGATDILVGNVHAPSVVFFNDGTGRTYSAVHFGDDHGAVYGFAVADLDGDGVPDIAAARSEAPSIVYFGARSSGSSPRP